MTANTSRRNQVLRFESKNKMRVELKKKMSRVNKKNLSRERENADQLCCQCLHFTETRLLSKVAVCWLPNIAEFFSSVARLRRGLGKAASFSVIWHFRIPISAPWRIEKHTCDSVVKILWDVWFFRKREVHPLYFKSDWNPPVQLSVALESYLEEVKSQLAEIKISQGFGFQYLYLCELWLNLFQFPLEGYWWLNRSIPVRFNIERVNFAISKQPYV